MPATESSTKTEKHRDRARSSPPDQEVYCLVYASVRAMLDHLSHPDTDVAAKAATDAIETYESRQLAGGGRNE